MPRLLAGLAVLTLTSTAVSAAPRPGPASEDVAAQRRRGLALRFAWARYGKEAFERARRERKPILIDGAAEWCHWCHVMDETTYRDPEVGRLIAERFVAVRVDIDERPDFQERYQDFGWPATIVLSPDGAELGKFRGYLAPERMREILERAGAGAAEARPVRGPADAAAQPVDLPWIGGLALVQLDAAWDDEDGGWGNRQKAPIGTAVQVELLRAAHGDAAAQVRAVRALDAQRALLDPVWGGLYQYSTGGDWRSPHFEKLMAVQATNLEACAGAARATGLPRLRKDAEAIARYMTEHLGAPDGRFFANQDADVGAHDRGARFVDGHAFYARDDRGRRALGMPWVDRHVYARENGLAIAALLALGEATGEARWVALARRAAEAIVKSHVRADGGVVHDAERPNDPRFLVDAAALGRALARLGEVTREPRWAEHARRIAAAMARDFADPAGGWFGRTLDDAATGALAERDRPLAPAIAGARFLAALARLTGQAAPREAARRALAVAASPRAVDALGRTVGELVLALDELGELRWR